MVVVNEAKSLIGQRKPGVGTGALQTPTGRMLFARLDEKDASTDTKLSTKSKSQGKPAKTSNRKPADPG